MEKIWFTNYVAPACLQTEGFDENPNVEMIASGWQTEGKAHWR